MNTEKVIEILFAFNRGWVHRANFKKVAEEIDALYHPNGGNKMKTELDDCILEDCKYYDEAHEKNCKWSWDAEKCFIRDAFKKGLIPADVTEHITDNRYALNQNYCERCKNWGEFGCDLAGITCKQIAIDYYEEIKE